MEVLQAEQLSYEELLKQNQELKEQVQFFIAQLKNLRRQVYGSKSDRFSSELQGALFEAPLPEEAPPEKSVEIKSHTRHQRGRKPLPKDLPRERIEYEPESIECPGCGKEMAKIGEEITTELEHIPARLFVLEHAKIKRACSCCKQGVFTGKLPAHVPIIEQGRPGVGLLAHIAVSKFCDHLPLHRLEQMFARHGVEIPRQRMCDWLGHVASFLEAVAHAIRDSILLEPYIQADETTIKVRDSEKKGKLHTGYLWGMRSPPGDVYFNYDRSRSSEVAAGLLNGYEGKVQTDAYAGYNPVFLPESCERLGCMAHVRRKFIEAQDSAGKECARVLSSIAELYKVEKKARHMSLDERLELRQKKSAKLVSDLEKILRNYQDTFLPKHPLHLACNYALNQWKELTLYLEHGELEIDNNAIEREMRPIAVGRKNYLFAGSHEGGNRAAIFYTIINTCKAHKINPYDYLVDVLKRIRTQPASEIQQLTPARWKLEKLKN